VQRDSGNTSTADFYYVQNYEMQNSIPLAGKTVVLSFYARAGANYSAASSVLRATIEYQTSASESNYWYIGDGASDVIAVTTNAALTTNWTRYTATVTLPSTVTQIFTAFKFTPVGTAGTNDYFEVTSVQLELGSTATTFSRAGGTIAGELAACQRYYVRFNSNANSTPFTTGGFTFSTTGANTFRPFPVEMRNSPTAIETGGTLAFKDVTAATFTPSAYTVVNGSNQMASFDLTLSGATSSRWGYLQSNSSGTNYIAFSAEL
jgi:hypothetical protein